MSQSNQLAERFMQALLGSRAEAYEAILDEDASLMIGGWDGSAIYRPRNRVIQALSQERETWPDPVLETFTVMADDRRAALEFRIQATERKRYVEHNRAAFLQFHDGRISAIRLYCPESLPSARRKGWIAPSTLTNDELRGLFESLMFAGDAHEWIPPNASAHLSLRGAMEGSGDAFPGSNSVGGVRWTEAEADQKIEEIISRHRDRQIGFQWFVTSFDTPADLSRRLERHGLALAGDIVTMARSGLSQLEIPTNPDVSTKVADPKDPQDQSALAHLLMVCFHWPQSKVEEQMPGMVERLSDPKFRDKDFVHLAYLRGEPVAFGRLELRGGVAFLGGAATLPEARGQRVYSTLLRLRMQAAAARGYHVAAINAAPLSRPIVQHYGFREYARVGVYAWMPVMNLDVVHSLVPQ